MSASGESQLKIGLSFDDAGQLIKVQQIFAKTEQVVNQTIENIKEYGIEFGKMAVKVAANYNSLEKIIFQAPEDIIDAARKTTGGLHDFAAGINTDVDRIETSLGKISPRLQQLFAPLGQRITEPTTKFIGLLEKVQGKVEMVAEKYQTYKKAVIEVRDAAVNVITSFKQVENAIPAAVQVFQDPKKLFNPEQWTTAIFPAIDAIGKFRENTIKLLEKVSDFPGIDKFAAKVESLVPVVGKFAKNVGKSMLDHLEKFGGKLGSLASKGFGFLSKGLSAIIPQVWAFTSALLANPVTWIVVGVIALGAAIYLLWKNWDKVVTWFKKGFQWLKDTLAKAPNWVIGLIAVFLPFIGIPLLIIKNWSFISTFFKVLVVKLGEYFSALWNKITNLAKAFFQWLREKLQKVPDWVLVVVSVFMPFIGIPLLAVKHWDKVLKILKTIGNVFGAVFNWNKMVNMSRNYFQWLQDRLSKMPNWVLNILAVIMPFIGIPLLIVKNLGAVVNFFKNLGQGIASFIVPLWNKLVNFFGKVFSLIWSVLSKVLLLPVRIIIVIGAILFGLLEKAFAALGSLLNSLWGLVVNVFNRITGAIGSAFKAAFSKIGSVVGPVLNPIFKSISKAVGPVLKAIWNQVVSVFTSIGNAIGSLFSSLWDTVCGLFTAAFGVLQSMLGGIIDFLTGIVDSVQSAFNSLWDGINGVFQSIGKMFENIVPSWAKDLFNWAINPEGNTPGKNAPNPANLDKHVNTNTASDRQAANQLNQSQNNRTTNTKNTKVDKIEINLNGGKNDQQTAKTVRNELLNFFGQQGTATVGG